MVGTLFAMELAIIRASLPPSLCCEAKLSAIMQVFFVWLVGGEDDLNR